MSEPYSVGQSKVRHWRNCRQAYHYKYEEKLISARTRRPFTFGKIVHRMIEAQAQGDDPMVVLAEIAEDVDNAKVFASEKELYGDIVEDIRTIMTDYLDYYPQDSLRMVGVKDEAGEFRFAEHEFAIPLADIAGRRAGEMDGIMFKGQVDGLGRTPNKLRWLVEHKTFDKLPGDDERWRNLQYVVYIRAVLHLGWMKSIDGVAWNYVMSKAPTVPQLLKDGSRLSVREIVTLPSVVRAAIVAAGLSETTDDHAKLLERAEQTRHDYFKRIFVPLNQTVADKIFDGFLDSARQMRDEHERSIDKNIGRHCGWCDYEPLCRAELEGGDLDFIKTHDFIVEEPEGYRRSGRGKRSDKLNIVG